MQEGGSIFAVAIICGSDDMCGSEYTTNTKYDPSSLNSLIQND